ncbi:ABC transporter permease [Phytoactinopolyspora halotolerans]|uniref:ABC transporter permease n=1 Tax=Phytoactinopolyspora halotolerans TaxID=1981512 RepID=A0A6L9SES2_9ACTN|nr:ABC transporter permease [Phytoactinopolyspora halotolerans]NEE02972.1 ABC transporter permease [Phytoactinopolyspora halotolerans]
MNPTIYACRLGLSRGWIETKNNTRTVDEWGWYVAVALVFAVVLFFQRDSTVEGTTQSLASVVLPSILGMMVAWSGILGPSGMLTVEREDGTLLRAKATPHGMVGYVVAKLVVIALATAVMLAIILAAGLIFVTELLDTPVTGWLGLLGFAALGLLATLPWGALIGSQVSNPQASFGLSMLPIATLSAISGIFYPITALAEWLQVVAQVFPMYWLGHGIRWALLPDDAAGAEIGEAWRLWEAVGVLSAWAVVGLLLAPPVLRRMARRESGSALEERRQQAMQRYGM